MTWIAATCVALAALLQALGYLVAGLWPGAVIALALGGLWLLALLRGWRRFDHTGLAGIVVLAGVGVWLTLPALLLVCSVVAALAGWDLARFDRRAAGVQIAGAEALVRAHLWRLALATGSGLLLGVLALSIRVSLGFGVALLLAALALIGLSRAIGHLNRVEERDQ
jgi:hypothetical protein